MASLSRRRLGAALLAVAGLAACGRKPGFVDPPEAVKNNDPFPRFYPLQSTDVRPGRRPPPDPPGGSLPPLEQQRRGTGWGKAPVQHSIDRSTDDFVAPSDSDSVPQ